MEWVELLELTNDFARLRYYPEQNSAVGEYGEVTYFRKTGQWRFDKLAEGYQSNYALHACKAAERIDKNGGTFPKSGIIGSY